jgi:hypothetical protein
MSKLNIFKFNEIFDNKLKFNMNIEKKYVKNSELKIDNGNIFVSGDIHGDYYLFIHIICELSNLIVINDNEKYNEFLKINNSKLMEEYLNSIKNDDINDIGLEWKDNIENTYFVFCGDLIDNKREDYDLKEKYGDNYIAFPEIKILYIIYFLNMKAKKQNKNNGIIKVCGNHDYGNLSMEKGKRWWISEYSYVYQEESLYGINRQDYFMYNLNVIPSKLLFHMMYPLIKINEHYFMHGGMNVIYFNDEVDVKKINIDFVNCINEEKDCKLFNDTKEGLLWDRTTSSSIFYDKEIIKTYKNIFKNKVIIVGHCAFITSAFNKICNEQNNKKYWTIFPEREDKYKNEEIIKTINYTESKFKQNTKLCDGKNHGITGQFWDKKKSRPRLIRLDVGMSQSFDGRENIFYDEKNLKENILKTGYILYGRLPQILNINIGDKNEYNVRTATVHRTLINNKRGIFKDKDENEIKEKTFDYGLINKDINYKKYLKYKLKYKILKNFI